MKEKIKNIVATQLGIACDLIDDEKDIMEHYGADSLDAVDILIAVEDSFEISIPDEEAVELRSISDILSYIKENK